MSNASKFADAVLVWIGMELLSPEWNKAFKKLWADFPEEMERARSKHGMHPSGFHDRAVMRNQRDKEDRAKYNCGTETCNGNVMCEDHYRQFCGIG